MAKDPIRAFSYGGVFGVLGREAFALGTRWGKPQRGVLDLPTATAPIYSFFVTLQEGEAMALFSSLGGEHRSYVYNVYSVYNVYNVYNLHVQHVQRVQRVKCMCTPGMAPQLEGPVGSPEVPEHGEPPGVVAGLCRPRALPVAP